MTCLPRRESTSFLSIIVLPVISQNSGSPLCSIYAIFRLPSQHRCEKPDKRLTHFSWCSEPQMLAHITSSQGVRWHLSVTLLRNSGMSSLQWFAPPEKPPSSDAPSTFWPAQFSNPPLVKPLASTPAPAPLDPYAFPPERYHSLHPPGYIYYPTTSQAKIYALSNEEDCQAFADPFQNRYDWIHPFSSPVYKVPEKCADVWNTVRWVVAGKHERGEDGQLSAAMRRALVDMVEEENEKEKKAKSK